jgi:hypothetical protein
VEQRKYPRYPVEYAASFSGDTISAQGVILDLSSVGYKARSTVAIEKGAFVGVLIDVPRYATPLQVALAVIRWSNGHEFGLEFIQMEPDNQQRPRELIRATEAAMALRRNTKT